MCRGANYTVGQGRMQAGNALPARWWAALWVWRACGYNVRLWGRACAIRILRILGAGAAARTLDRSNNAWPFWIDFACKDGSRW